MADNPVDNKAVDVLAAAVGVPTPAPATSLLGTAWRYRKLVLVLGGAGLVATAGGYGYKYLTADPGKASAQTTPPAIAEKPDDPKPGDDLPPIRPPAPAARDDVPAIPAVKVPGDDLPDVRPPIIKPPANDPTDTAPPLLPPGSVDRPKTPAGDNLLDIAPPPAPGIKPPGTDKKGDDDKPTGPVITVPNTDKKKPADGGDQFKASDKVPTIGAIKVGPAPLPTDVTDKKDRTNDGPVVRVRGDDPPKVPDAPKVEVPAAKKDDPSPAPKIPNIDIDLPPPPGPVKKDDSPIVVPPPGGKDDMNPPIVVPGPKPDVPPVVVGPKDTGPEVKTPDVPTVKPPASADPPSIPPIDVKPDAAAKRDTYSEDWHTWKEGDTYALISQEYYHDAKYAAALDAYNKKHRKPGDRFVRVPDLWKLEELFPDLVGTSDKAAVEVKPAGGGGLKFEPVAPLPGDRRPAPPVATTSRSNDEYRVTAEAGETIREVARKAFRDAGSWKKLYELNPGIDPTLPIPAGTTLRLR